MNPLEKEIARQNPINTDAPLSFTEKELLALLDECVEFELALRDSDKSNYDAGFADAKSEYACRYCEDAA
jgi:hypothetical protein